jgi:hypothetical protein
VARFSTAVECNFETRRQAAREFEVGWKFVYRWHLAAAGRNFCPRVDNALARLAQDWRMVSAWVGRLHVLAKKILALEGGARRGEEHFYQSNVSGF